MKGKSIFVQFLTLIVALGSAFKGIVSATMSAWFGVAGSTATVLLSIFWPSGVLVQGWNAGMIIFNSLLAANQLLNIWSGAGFIPIDVSNYIMVSINLIIQIFLKDYGSGSVMEKKIV